MPEILVQRDNLDEASRRFEQARLDRPVFLNSIPKSGSHLLRNIMRMFVPVEQTYPADFIQWGNLQAHCQAFDPASPKLSWGHLFYADASRRSEKNVSAASLSRSARWRMRSSYLTTWQRAPSHAAALSS